MGAAVVSASPKLRPAARRDSSKERFSGFWNQVWMAVAMISPIEWMPSRVSSVADAKASRVWKRFARSRAEVTPICGMPKPCRSLQRGLERLSAIAARRLAALFSPMRSRFSRDSRSSR